MSRQGSLIGAGVKHPKADPVGELKIEIIRLRNQANNFQEELTSMKKRVRVFQITLDSLTRSAIVNFYPEEGTQI